MLLPSPFDRLLWMTAAAAELASVATTLLPGTDTAILGCSSWAFLVFPVAIALSAAVLVMCSRGSIDISPLLWMSLARVSCSCDALNFVEPKKGAAAGITVAAVAELLLVMELVVLL